MVAKYCILRGGLPDVPENAKVDDPNLCCSSFSGLLTSGLKKIAVISKKRKPRIHGIKSHFHFFRGSPPDPIIIGTGRRGHIQNTTLPNFLLQPNPLTTFIAQILLVKRSVMGIVKDRFKEKADKTA